MFTYFQVFDARDRASLLFDAFRLASADQLPYDNALNMTRYLCNETHFVPWSTASDEFFPLLRRLFGTPAYELVQVS